MMLTTSFRTGVLAVLMALCALAFAGPASADFGFVPGSLTFSTTEADGVTPLTQAGGHPDFTTVFSMRHGATTPPDENLKDADIELPLGVVGNANATPKCSVADAVSNSGCSPDAQVGVMVVNTYALGTYSDTPPSPIYNVYPQPGEPAAFAAKPNGYPVRIDTSVGPESGYRVHAVAGALLELLPVGTSTATFWGVPSAHTGVGVPHALMTNPTACTGQAIAASAVANSWEHQNVFVSTVGSLAPTTGCDKLRFAPSIRVAPDTLVAGEPAGYSVDVDVPQSDDPSGLATPALKDSKVVFPQGVVFSPSVAHGLQACSDAQLAITSNSDDSCPAASKVGTVTITSPVLPDPIGGNVFIGQPLPGNRYRIFLSISEHGVVIKLAGTVSPDPVTGQLTTTFDDNPPLPFSNLHLEFNGGPDAPLANPTSCGTYTTTSVLVSSGGQTATPSSSFVINDGCGARAFKPVWSAGTQSTVAGAATPFTLQISRTDADQEIDSVNADLPPGLLGLVSQVPLCTAAEAAAGACPAASQVGTTTVASGPGSDPFTLGGKVYLTDGYKGAPFGLLFSVPAIAGPYDLGVVNVRASISVDPITAALHVTSDALPRILEGVPLQIRSVRVDVDRPGFMRNPTNCSPLAIAGTIGSTSGLVAAVFSPFSVGDCAALDVAPKLAVALTGKGQTTDDKHPGVHAVVTQGAGQANLKKVTVTLPLSLALDPDNAQALCEFADGSKVDPSCPKGSVVGTAIARTPVLHQPLSGPVYFVKNVRKDPKSGRDIRTLPKLVIPLTGENGVRLNLVGTSSVVDNRLVTTFDNIPDAPLTDFTLDITGGSHGILVVSGTDICKATQVADQQVDGQNGKTADASIYLQTPACSLKVLSKKTTKSSVAIKVGGLSAGKVTVSGKGIKKTTKTISKSTVATITAKRTKGKPGKVTVSFDPAGPAKAHKTTK